jgi:hypothetical protein
MRVIEYNSQRNNLKVNNLGAYSQCFSTVNWMRMSHYCSAIKAGDDAALADFLKQVETVIGPQMEHVPHPSLYFNVQRKCVTSLLNLMGVSGYDVFESKVSIRRLYELLQSGPVTVGTSKLGGLPGGHIILAVDMDCYNDPFGDANTDYADDNGAGVIYKSKMIAPHFTGNVLYWSNKIKKG